MCLDSKAGRGDGVGLVQDIEDVKVQSRGESDGDDEEADDHDGHEVDPVVDAAEFLNQFLLLESIAVGGLTDHFQAIFEAPQRGVLFDDLFAKIELVGVQLNQTLFYGDEIDRRRAGTDKGGW